MDAGSCKIIVMPFAYIANNIWRQMLKKKKQTVNKELFFRVLVYLPLSPVMETKNEVGGLTFRKKGQIYYRRPICDSAKEKQ